MLPSLTTIPQMGDGEYTKHGIAIGDYKTAPAQTILTLFSTLAKWQNAKPKQSD